MNDITELRICSKTRYTSEEDVKEAIDYLVTQDPEATLDYYKCHVCHNFHLTSKV